MFFPDTDAFLCMTAVIPEPRGGGSIFPAGNEHRGCTARPADTSGIIAAVVMVTFNRPSYLQKASSSLLSVHRRDPSYECALRAKSRVTTCSRGPAPRCDEVGRSRAPHPARRKKFPLYISQDGSHQGVKELALSLGPRVKYMQHIEDAPPKLKTRCHIEATIMFKVHLHEAATRLVSRVQDSDVVSGAA